MPWTVPSRYHVDILQDPDDLPPEHRVRFITCLERRFAKLEGTLHAGGTIDILDAFEGPFVWEMTPEQLEAIRPVGVEFTMSRSPSPPMASSRPSFASSTDSIVAA